MRSATLALSLGILVSAPLTGLVGCDSTPPTAEAREAKVAAANDTLKRMMGKDPSIEKALDGAYGYAIIPTVGSGALIIGGEGGSGIVFEGGSPWGTVSLAKGSIGFQIGGEAYSELVILKTEEAFKRFTAGEFSFSAEATATAVKAGAAAAAPIADGMLVLVDTKGGLMASAAVGGQDFSCRSFD